MKSSMFIIMDCCYGNKGWLVMDAKTDLLIYCHNLIKIPFWSGQRHGNTVCISKDRHSHTQRKTKTPTQIFFTLCDAIFTQALTQSTGSTTGPHWLQYVLLCEGNYITAQTQEALFPFCSDLKITNELTTHSWPPNDNPLFWSKRRGEQWAECKKQTE